jgi:hypothetical protein
MSDTLTREYKCVGTSSTPFGFTAELQPVSPMTDDTITTPATLDADFWRVGKVYLVTYTEVSE